LRFHSAPDIRTFRMPLLLVQCADIVGAKATKLPI
jgi:hypothetical protein